MTDILSPVKRSKNMAAIKNKNTKPEIYIRKRLFSRGYRYRIAPSNIPGHPDIYLSKYNLAIFIHGCFWHRHNNCKLAYTPKSRVEFWNNKFETNIARDSKVIELLSEKNIRFLIIWECAIRDAQKKNDDGIQLIDRIESFILSEQYSMEIPEVMDKN